MEEFLMVDEVIVVLANHRLHKESEILEAMQVC